MPSLDPRTNLELQCQSNCVDTSLDCHISPATAKPSAQSTVKPPETSTRSPTHQVSVNAVDASGLVRSGSSVRTRPKLELGGLTGGVRASSSPSPSSSPALPRLLLSTPAQKVLLPLLQDVFQYKEKVAFEKEMTFPFKDAIMSELINNVLLRNVSVFCMKSIIQWILDVVLEPCYLTYKESYECLCSPQLLKVFQLA